MKTIRNVFRIFLILFLAGLCAVFFLRLPSWPFGGDIDRIDITYSSAGKDNDTPYTLTHEADIAAIREAAGIVWFSPFTLNSLGGLERWRIEVHHPNDSSEWYWVTPDEFADRGSTPQRLRELLQQKYREKPHAE
ncbi:hypothetical protein [Ruficoccus sp. ZRK36]|uniref:hypothetical protein n=1 Tax=Ruficoccus sp. ZRK36 TaxID=2866311 RepID=UPI001C73532F|nr:hypothetical protein [Ruficoccus sp. ZRK36]QYY35607.1 hypothetical protein K0V07_15075 [Ruficoccus sp. ZRK36]